jgi:hypothetical protein
MSKFFLGPNFREKLNMGTVNSISFPSQTHQEIAAEEELKNEAKKEAKDKGKSDGKEQRQQ